MGMAMRVRFLEIRVAETQEKTVVFLNKSLESFHKVPGAYCFSFNAL